MKVNNTVNDLKRLNLTNKITLDQTKYKCKIHITYPNWD